ncbi:Cobalt-precorrin-4 C(11)-methyltransferase [hydrothermal vent metagenome]|uniref:Cobalt-precorrin-4 C(11)-methyltransferase n=1 Tax=hydrothermal vent metagenome TaxID=652676 RepID=A0A3B1CYD2_9ZZZZ
MKVFFVGAGPGDPELLTVKAKKLLEACNVCVYAGSLVSDEVIALIPTSSEKHDSATMNLNEIIEVFINASKRGLDVIRLHSGDPAIYGAIGEQMKRLDELGFEYEVIPGISSFQASAALLKKELTAPEVSQTIILTRVAGRTPAPAEQDLAILGKSRATLCIFLSVLKIDEMAQKLMGSYGKNAPVKVVYRASLPNQLVIHGTLFDIAEKVRAAKITKTAMIIVGWALDNNNEAVSKLYDKSFSHECRKAQ